MEKIQIPKSRTFVIIFIALFTLLTGCQKEEPHKLTRLRGVPFTDVTFADEFWARRIETNRKVTVPYAFKKCEETGRISNFAKAGGLMEGKFEGIYFNDSDLYKVIEGAAYSLENQGDPELEKYVDGVIDKIAAAQWEDGYLYTFYSVPRRQPEKRWSDIRDKHELYCAGHFFEGAVAYYQATGKRKILDVAIRLADYIDLVFGPDKKRDVPGHEEIEIGMVKLYRVTGNEKYLKLAKFFLDERGRAEGHKLYGEYSQDHKPVVEQDKAVGHAVRAGYLYSGMADVAALTGEMDFACALDRIWEDVVSKKLYLTGGIGARRGGESFGNDYELPNKTAYCETCAAIANAMWNHRLFLLHGEAKYIDVLERVIYNGFLSGISLSGDKFFYPNPLASDGKHQRSPWFGCACCPTNIVRFMPSLPGYAYARRGDIVYVNLFVSGSATIKMDNNTVRLRQQTRYPWDGDVKITVEPKRSGEFAIYVRIPGWAQNQPVPSDLYRYLNKSRKKVTLKVNDKPFALDMDKGFARIRRKWKKGDVVELSLPMPIRRVLSHENVKDTAGKAALQRGPIVYCVEWPDNGGQITHIVLPDDAELKAKYRKDMLGGITVISGTVLGVQLSGMGSVVAMLSVGEGASKEALEHIRKLGSNNIIISVVKSAEEEQASTEHSFMSIYGLTYEDYARIAESFGNIKQTAPVKLMRKNSRLRERAMELRVVGTTPEWFKLVPQETLAGRVLLPSNQEKRSPVAVLTEFGARKILATESTIGQTIRIGGDQFEVIGIVKSESGQAGNIQIPDQEVDVYIPIEVARRYFGDVFTKYTSGSRVREKVELHQIIVQVDEAEKVEAVAAGIERMLEQFHKKKDYVVSVPLALLKQAGKDGKSLVKDKGYFAAIPYYAWAHRGKGEMAVWLARSAKGEGK